MVFKVMTHQIDSPIQLPTMILDRKLAFDNGKVCRLFSYFQDLLQQIYLLFLNTAKIEKKQYIVISRSGNIQLFSSFHSYIRTSFLTNEACQILRLKSFVENSIFAYLNFLQFVHFKPTDGFVRICNMSFAKLLWKSIKTTHIQK